MFGAVYKSYAALFVLEVFMSFENVIALIGSVGFPIVACIAMAWFYMTQFKDFTDLVVKNNILTEELIALLKEDGNRV